MNKLEELIKEYTRTFKENFPIFLIPSMPETEIIQIIEKCLKENVPYKPEYKKNVVH
jgi:uncharacterized protein with ATP-grasp and redox domains